MNLKFKKILGIDISISSKSDILEEIRKYFPKIRNPKSEIRKKDIKPLVIFTPNPEIINYAQNDEAFKEIVDSAQINLPDGAGVVWAINKLHGLNIQKIPGVEFMLDLAKIAEEKSLRIGLIGGRDGLAVKTLECLLKNHPTLSGWANDGPEVKIQNYPAAAGSTMLYLLNTHKQHRDKLQITNEQIEEIVDKIIKEKTDILFVAMGFPKQEYFIARLARQFQISNFKFQIVLMAVGGAFDYISGGVPRAPKWMRNMGLEWLFRLIIEPWRLLRQLRGAEFFWKVLNS